MTHHDALPVIPAQQAFFEFQKRHPNNPAFLVTAIAWIHGPGHPDALRKAVLLTLSESPIFESSLRRDESGEIMHLLDTINPVDELATLDFSAGDDPAADLAEWLDSTAAAGLPLFDGPVGRHRILIMSPNLVGYYTAVQHMVVDGYATSLLFTRILNLYREIRDTGAPESDTPFGDHRALIAAVRPPTDADIEFWTTYTADLPPEMSLTTMTAAPSPRPRRMIRDITGLRKVDRGNWIHRCTAAIAAYMTRYLDADEAVLGSPRANRANRLERSVPVTMMSNLPIRVPVRPEDTVFDTCTTVRDQLRITNAHTTIRTDQIMSAAAGSWRASRFYGPTVNVIPFPLASPLGEIDCAIEVLSWGPVDDITAVITPTAGSTDGRIELNFNSDLYTAAEAELHSVRLAAWIQRFVAAPHDTPISQLPFFLDEDMPYVTMFTDMTVTPVASENVPFFGEILTAATALGMSGAAAGSTLTIVDGHGRTVAPGRCGRVHVVSPGGEATTTDLLVVGDESGWRFNGRVADQVLVKGSPVNLHEQVSIVGRDPHVLSATSAPESTGIRITIRDDADPAAVVKALRFQVARGVGIDVAPTS
ncbi:condensation domain-containing protein [Gordonia sp. VNK1]|uniref:condensation domain-containing protein n=1 Tax=Gordonia oleivorans TaxID=3156618 RepID=UPI0032B53C20